MGEKDDVEMEEMGMFLCLEERARMKEVKDIQEKMDRIIKCINDQMAMGSRLEVKVSSDQTLNTFSTEFICFGVRTSGIQSECQLLG